LTTTRNDLVIAASCQVIANSMTVTETGLGEGSSVRLWRKILDVGLKHRSTVVQEAAADAMRIISDLTDASADVSR
jgi:tubulin-specific chaperone D